MRSKVPDCFTPQENVVYPLCVGLGKKKCKRCNLWADWEPFEDDENECGAVHDGKDK